MLGDNLTGFQHLGLPVTNIDASKAFYARLGFKEVMTRELPHEGGTLCVSMMELNGFILELYQLVGAELEEIRRRQDGHIDHMALDVKDIDAAFAVICAGGFTPLEDKPAFLPFWEHGIYYFNIRGLDGERIEFCQRIRA